MTDELAGRLVNPKAWSESLPEPIFLGLSQWIKGQPFNLLHRRWRTEGKSGSYVASVQLQRHRGMLTGAMLKILPERLAIRESRAVALAEDFGPKRFVHAHVTRTTWVGPLPGNSGSWLHIQEVAHSGSARMLSLSDLVDDVQLGDFCAAILSAIAVDWNTGRDDPPPMMTTPGAFLRWDLGDKLPGLRSFMSRVDPDPERPTAVVHLPSRPDPLPNPLWLLENPEHGPIVEVYLGKGHGDLHLDNILVPVDGSIVDASRFQLIDIGRFSEQMPISRDPAKLLLSVMGSWLPSLTPGSAIRSSLAELAVAPKEFPQSPPIAGYLQVTQQIHEAAASWAVRRSLMPDWPEQHKLVVAAAALRAATRIHVAEADRWWYVELAALALRQFPPAPGASGSSAPPPTPPSAHRRQPAVTSDVPKVPTAEIDPIDEFSRRLGADWQDLVDILDILPQEKRRFTRGDEPRYLWRWLEVRGRMDQLRTALISIGREDLTPLVDQATRQ